MSAAPAGAEKPALASVGGYCANCVRAFVREGKPSGELISLRSDDGAMAPAYLKRAPAGSPTPTPTILIVTDVFGYRFKNSQVLADEYAARGFNVIVPDIFKGGGIDGDSTAPLMDVEKASFFSAAGTVCSFVPSLVSFLWANGSRAVMQPRVQALARSAREKAIELGGPGAKMGAVGFCFGGPYAVLLAKTPGLIDAWAGVHPSGLAVPADLQGLGAAPGFFALSEHDHMITRAVADKMKAALPAAEVAWYTGVSHGFAVRGPPSADKMREKCAEDVCAFFKKALA
jgi:dienelactone hydrolase